MIPYSTPRSLAILALLLLAAEYAAKVVGISDGET